MAGAKGRSGGARPGAGRKSNAEKARLAAEAAGIAGGSTPAAGVSAADAASAPAGTDPVEHDSLSYMRALLNDPTATRAEKMKAAILLAPYEYQKLEDGGVKPARQRAAVAAGVGKFAPAAPPKLRSVK